MCTQEDECTIWCFSVVGLKLLGPIPRDLTFTSFRPLLPPAVKRAIRMSTLEGCRRNVGSCA